MASWQAQGMHTRIPEAAAGTARVLAAALIGALIGPHSCNRGAAVRLHHGR
jgi:Mn2+/Fe2+ NRAMP family transporter